MLFASGRKSAKAIEECMVIVFVSVFQNHEMVLEAKYVRKNKEKLILEWQIIFCFAATLFSSGFSIFVRPKQAKHYANQRKKYSKEVWGGVFSPQNFCQRMSFVLPA